MELKEKIEILEKENSSLDKQTNLLSRVLLFWAGVGAGSIGYFIIYYDKVFVSFLMSISFLLSIFKVGRILSEFKPIYDKLKFNNKKINDLTKDIE